MAGYAVLGPDPDTSLAAQSWLLSERCQLRGSIVHQLGMVSEWQLDQDDVCVSSPPTTEWYGVQLLSVALPQPQNPFASTVIPLWFSQSLLQNIEAADECIRIVVSEGTITLEPLFDAVFRHSGPEIMKGVLDLDLGGAAATASGPAAYSGSGILSEPCMRVLHVTVLRASLAKQVGSHEGMDAVLAVLPVLLVPDTATDSNSAPEDGSVRAELLDFYDFLCEVHGSNRAFLLWQGFLRDVLALRAIMPDHPSSSVSAAAPMDTDSWSQPLLQSLDSFLDSNGLVATKRLLLPQGQVFSSSHEGWLHAFSRRMASAIVSPITHLCTKVVSAVTFLQFQDRALEHEYLSMCARKIWLLDIFTCSATQIFLLLFIKDDWERDLNGLPDDTTAQGVVPGVCPVYELWPRSVILGPDVPASDRLFDKLAFIGTNLGAFVATYRLLFIMALLTVTFLHLPFVITMLFFRKWPVTGSHRNWMLFWMNAVLQPIVSAINLSCLFSSPGSWQEATFCPSSRVNEMYSWEFMSRSASFITIFCDCLAYQNHFHVEVPTSAVIYFHRLILIGVNEARLFGAIDWPRFLLLALRHLAIFATFFGVRILLERRSRAKFLARWTAAGMDGVSTSHMPAAVGADACASGAAAGSSGWSGGGKHAKTE